ncbi:olfactory receptor 6B1-like [Rhinophrynus dorsalis]
MSESIFLQTKGPQNQTFIREVLILGFQVPSGIRVSLFSVFLVTYLLTLSGNLLIIVLMLFSELLESPMYYFLCNLSLSEMLFTTNIIPVMLHVLLTNGVTISITGCLTQFFLFGSFVVTECFLLTVMSYDRYLAICSPLHYSSIMDFWCCRYLSFTCWALALLVMSISLGVVSTLHFCDLNIIDHFFCDFVPLLVLSCSDTITVEMVVNLLATASTLFPFIFIVVTYGCIIRSILKIQTVKGKKKAFSTCSSHLGVVSTFYTTVIMVYAVPSRGHTSLLNKILSLIYIVVTPLLNPIIYTLRNQEIKSALRVIFIDRRSILRF